ncbi:MAG: ATP-binding cassette domain-containing protein [Spirochaetales bacterium]|jgi:molybdate transport system ATP-binding protein|nr:ATP-binding cassette domain-containing protein [Spirochaetales bacterium]
MLKVDIKKKYSGFNLEVQFETEGETLALLGASGCGKSMTLRCIAGVIKPDEGRISLNGRVFFDSAGHINLSPQKRRIGLLFQNYALFPGMTVEQNILTGLHREKGGSKKQRLRALLDSFYLTGQRNHYPAQLSGGQQQRAALARIIAGGPHLIMLDEPLSALDSYLRWQLEQTLISALEQFNGPAVYVSHNRDEVYRICRRVCIINNGKSEQTMDVKTLFVQPETFSAALLSGCKNYSRAEKQGENTLFALDWNCRITRPNLPENLRYIGLRAHYISLGQNENTISCRVLRVTDDVFSTILTVIPQGVPETDFSRIRLELPKTRIDGIAPGSILTIGFKSSDVLPLH